MNENDIIPAINSLKEAILTLDESVRDLSFKVDSNTAIQHDLLKNDPHDMMQNINGSMQELIKLLENRTK